MMPVTGNSAEAASRKVLSIQPSLNGLSFAVVHGGRLIATGQWAGAGVTALPDAFGQAVAGQPLLGGGFDRVFVLVDTGRCCLVPASLSGEVPAVGWLARHGLDPQDGEQVVSSPVIADTVAFALVGQDVCRWLEDRYGERLAYAVPLQTNLLKKHAVPTVEINVGPDRTWLSAFRDKVLLAETLPGTDVPDLLFYLSQLDDAWGLRDFALLLTGVYATETLRELRRFFPRLAADRQIARRPGAAGVKPSTRFNNVIYICDADY